jgi:glycosyltransferase involved in cell wall biosynthesis
MNHVKRLLVPFKRRALRGTRRALHWYMSAPPRKRDLDGADRRVLILLMSAWGMGGTIRAAHNMAGHLASKGYDVEIGSVIRLRGEAFFSDGLPEGVDVIALDDHRADATPRWLRPVRDLLRRRESLLANPNDIHQERWWNLWVDVQLARLLHRRAGFLVTTRPSLNLISAEYASPALVKVGLEQINLGAWGKTLRSSMARHYPKLDVLVGLTATDLEAYDRLLGGKLRLQRIPNTVYPMGGPRPDLSTKRLVAAGRFMNQKGFDLLIPAFAKIAADFPDWSLRIHGKGPLKQQLEQMIDESGLGERIELAGPANDMGAALAEASIFVLSSRFEGFPLILIEAMSKGLAVVSYDCPTGPSDIVDDHENGILVPAKDIDALAAGMREVMADEQLRRRVGAAATESAKAYEIGSIGPHWEELLTSLTNARDGQGGP